MLSQVCHLKGSSVLPEGRYVSAIFVASLDLSDGWSNEGFESGISIHNDSTAELMTIGANDRNQRG